MPFVNYLGQEIGLVDHGGGAKKRSAPEKPEEFHKGWRVVGLPPGALADAEKAHAKELAAANEHNRLHDKGERKSRVPVPKAWSPEFWLMNARGVPVRGKPYEIRDAAEKCKGMAEAAGWLRVEIVELAKRKGV